MTHAPLTVHTLTALGTVAEAAQTNARVRWLAENDDVLEGTARSIGTDTGMFLSGQDDVRDGYLRVTSTSGWDYFLPVLKVAEMVAETTFCIDREG